jgi:phenylalanyl-tRNA synthetase beta chain
VRRNGEVLSAVPPVGRRDLEREEDLIEEVARHVGYDRIPEAMPVEAMHQGRRTARLETELAARDALIRASLTEALTVTLISPRLLDRFGLAADDPLRQAVPLVNPLTAEHTHLRTCLLPGLLEAAQVNVNRRRDAVHLFEIGKVFAPRDNGIDEHKALAIAMRGTWMEGVWDQPADAQQVTFFHLKGVLEEVAAELHAGGLTLEGLGASTPNGSAPPPWLHPTRAGRVLLAGQPIGVAGELHPDVAERFDLPGPTYVAELDLEPLLDRAVLQPRYAGSPRYPAVRRDVAVVAPVDLPHATVEAALRASVGDLLGAIQLFDVYVGAPLPAGTRNLAYTLIFRAPDRTLTGEEVEDLMRRIHETLPASLPVSIRT